MACSSPIVKYSEIIMVIMDGGLSHIKCGKSNFIFVFSNNNIDKKNVCERFPSSTVVQKLMCLSGKITKINWIVILLGSTLASCFCFSNPKKMNLMLSSHDNTNMFLFAESSQIFYRVASGNRTLSCVKDSYVQSSFSFPFDHTHTHTRSCSPGSFEVISTLQDKWRRVSGKEQRRKAGAGV